MIFGNLIICAAICVSPQLIDLNTENPIDAILLTQKVCNLVTNTINFKLREKLNTVEDPDVIESGSDVSISFRAE